MNTIVKLSLWKEGRIWMFDDENFGLVSEPFVGNTNVALDFIAEGDNKMEILFSANPFPESIKLFEFMKEEWGGSTFHCREIDSECWLCAAMWHYFDQTPKAIYISKVK